MTGDRCNSMEILFICSFIKFILTVDTCIKSIFNVLLPEVFPNFRIFGLSKYFFQRAVSVRNLVYCFFYVTKGFLSSSSVFFFLFSVMKLLFINLRRRAQVSMSLIFENQVVFLVRICEDRSLDDVTDVTILLSVDHSQPFAFKCDYTLSGAPASHQNETAC